MLKWHYINNINLLNYEFFDNDKHISELGDGDVLNEEIAL